MKILYVGTLDPYGTCYSRWCALRELESDVHGFDVEQYFNWAKLARWHSVFERHAHFGPLLSRANAALESVCRDLKPNLVWIDKGDWVWAGTLRALRSQGCFLVQYITDALNPTYWRVRLQRKLLRTTARHYDVFFTTNVHDYAQLAPTTPPTTVLTDLGFDHRRFESSPLSPTLAKEWDHPIIFIGHYEPHTEAGVLALIEAGLPVTVFGHTPWFASKNRARLSGHLFPQLGNEDYVYALKGARIGLCFVSALNYNQTAGRSFEIPACGSLLLAARTPQHLDCYKEGVEAEFFGDHHELVEKARYYLEHEDERKEMARRGHERCNSSGYSWDSLMTKDWQRVKQIYFERRRS